jgi:hypothetical protein
METIAAVQEAMREWLDLCDKLEGVEMRLKDLESIERGYTRSINVIANKLICSSLARSGAFQIGNKIITVDTQSVKSIDLVQEIYPIQTELPISKEVRKIRG